MIKNNDNVGFLLLPKAINNGPVVHPLRASRNLYIQRKNTIKTKKSEQIPGVEQLLFSIWTKFSGVKQRICRTIEPNFEAWNERLCRTIEPGLKIS